MPDKTILIAATSGRMLAQLASKAGYVPLVIDSFADLDTCQMAAEVRIIKTLRIADLEAAVDYFQKKYRVRQAVYGSGFETFPDSLQWLSEKFHLLGNKARYFNALHDKRQLFTTLDHLGIPYPEVSFSRPLTFEEWLTKPERGEGGRGITCFDPAVQADRQACYWQRYISGEPLSVLFLADGCQAQIIGFNRQWTIALQKTQSCIFSGVKNKAELSDENQLLLGKWLEQLVKAFSLRGINSLDLIRQGEQCYFLEINPRPSASMMLYADNLFTLHAQASRGKLPERMPETSDHKAYQVLYADKEITIPPSIMWPSWSQDRPMAGSLIRNGQPICSIIASDESSQQVCAKLRARQVKILKLLKGKEKHAIHCER